MKIGIDARELCGKPTGVGRYLASLLAAWNDLPEAAGHRFVLYAPAPMPGAMPAPNLEVSWRVIPPRPAEASGRPTGPAGTVWEQFHLARELRRDRPDVLFAPAYTAPLAAGVPTVVTVHDLSFVAHPEWFPPTMRWRQRLLTTAAARRARRVLTDSEFSRREIIERLRVQAGRVTAIPLGFTPPTAGSAASVLGQVEPLVLFVGSIFTRRHLPELIRAVGAIGARRQDVRLEIVGDNRTYPRQDLAGLVGQAGLGGLVSLRSYVSDQTLAGLYGRARLFVFLSDYEGFGLTPLEALASGMPILVGDTPVAREIYGEAAAYVATTDEAAIAAEIERLLFDEPARRSLLARAPGLLARYSWARAGRETLAILLGRSSSTAS